MKIHYHHTESIFWYGTVMDKFWDSNTFLGNLALDGLNQNNQNVNEVQTEL